MNNVVYGSNWSTKLPSEVIDVADDGSGYVACLTKRGRLYILKRGVRGGVGGGGNGVGAAEEGKIVKVRWEFWGGVL